MPSHHWYLKIRIDLAEQPEVLVIAGSTRIDPDAVVGKLVRFWGWLKKSGKAGKVAFRSDVDRDVTLRHLEATIGGGSGFVQALQNVGWLSVTQAALAAPHFEKYMAEGERERELARDRKRRQREREAGVTSRDVTVTVTTREEEKREEKRKNTPLPPRGGVTSFPAEIDTPEFREAWGRWERCRSEARKPLRPTTIAAQLKKLAGMGLTRALATLEHSITNGYQGLFEPAPPVQPPHLFQSKLDAFFPVDPPKEGSK